MPADATAAEPKVGMSPAGEERAAFLRNHGYTGPVDYDGNPTPEHKTTTAFGQPLDEKGLRFFALRDAGYRGPIDQDGNPTSEHADIFAALDRAGERAGAAETHDAGRPAGDGDGGSRWSFSDDTQVNFVGGGDVVAEQINYRGHVIHTTATVRTDGPDVEFGPGATNIRSTDSHVGRQERS